MNVGNYDNNFSTSLSSPEHLPSRFNNDDGMHDAMMMMVLTTATKAVAAAEKHSEIDSNQMEMEIKPERCHANARERFRTHR